MSIDQTNQPRFPTTQNPLIVNALSGATQATLVTLTGYPFDLVKARLQTKKYPNSWQCVKGTIQNEGILGLYRGSAMPWLSHLVKRPIQYPISEYLKTVSAKNGWNQKVKYADNYLIGAGTGLIGPIFGTPLQVVKVAVQTSTDGEIKNSWKYVKENYQRNGLLRGFYRGFWPTVMKDSIFGMSFIGNYYTFREMLGTDTWWKNFVNGAAAHCLTWYVFIPIDYVKTNIQRSETKLTVRQVIQTSIKQHGPLVFWRGVIPACLRTIPVSGIAMTGYEYVRQKLLN